MAVRAVQQVLTPPLSYAGEVRHLVAQTGGHQDSAGGQRRAAGEPDPEAGVDAEHLVVDQRPAVRRHLGPAGCDQVARRHAVAGQEALHVGGGRVARRSGVHHGDAAPGPGQDQCRTQAGCAATDHHHVVFVHAPTVGARRFEQQLLLLFPGQARSNRRVDDSTTINAALDAVGPRLKRLRSLRGVTLADLSATTGISKSTLSRSGDRPAPAEPGGAAAAGAGLPGAAGRAGRRARGRRPARAAEAAPGERPHRAPPDPAARRRTGLEDPHPGEPDRAPAQGPRGLRVAVRDLRPDAAGPRRPRPGAQRGRGRRVRHPAAALVRQCRRQAGRGAQPVRSPG